MSVCLSLIWNSRLAVRIVYACIDGRGTCAQRKRPRWMNVKGPGVHEVRLKSSGRKSREYQAFCGGFLRLNFTRRYTPEDKWVETAETNKCGCEVMGSLGRRDEAWREFRQKTRSKHSPLRGAHASRRGRSEPGCVGGAPTRVAVGKMRFNVCFVAPSSRTMARRCPGGGR